MEFRDLPMMRGAAKFRPNLWDFSNGWPQERLQNDKKRERWLHSDIKDIAYPFTGNCSSDSKPCTLRSMKFLQVMLATGTISLLSEASALAVDLQKPK
jgi:hypothetical protein